MESLELFAGQATFSEVAKSNGFKPTSVDIDIRSKASIVVDILNWDYKNAKIKPAVIWASPECTYLSRAAKQSLWGKTTVKYRQYSYEAITTESQLALALVNKTVEIIDYFKPQVFFIENPIGRIQHLKPIKGIGHNRYFVNYADWGFPYSKETYIFTNIMLPLPTTKQKTIAPGLRSLNNKKQRSRIPLGLLQFLFRHAYYNLNM